jgi:Na+-driven multidrug efflux pump
MLRHVGTKCGIKQHHVTEMRILAKLAAPVCTTYVLSFGLQIVNMLVVGRVGAEALAAAALGNMFANASGNSIIMGAASACDTLQSQAYGAGNFRRVGSISQRGVVILLVLCAPISLAWYHADLILENVGQDTDTALLAVNYVKLLIPGLPAAAIYEVLKKHLQSLGIMTPPMLISSTAILINGVLGYILVFHTPLSFFGAPVSNSIAQWGMLFLMIMYFRHHRIVNAKLRSWRLMSQLVKAPAGSGLSSNPLAPSACRTGDSLVAVDVEEADLSAFGPAELPRENTASAASPVAAASSETGSIPECADDEDQLIEKTWHQFSRREAFSGWKEFASLGFPSACMLLVEWGSFEAAALISGLVSMYALAAHTIIATTAGLSFMPILGFSVAAGIRVGQKMGERRPKDAALTYRVLLVIAGIYVSFNVIFITSVRTVWGRLFTEDDKVSELLSNWLILLAAYTVFDAFQCVCSGVLRGAGRPALAAGANIMAYLVIGLPSSYLLAINAGLGLPGVWLGFILAVFVAYIFMAMALSCLDWEKESKHAYERALQGLVQIQPSNPQPPTTLEDFDIKAQVDALTVRTESNIVEDSGPDMRNHSAT